MYERSFAVSTVADPATMAFVPLFAVKEQNGTNDVHMLVRLLYTGTPAPCPLYYASVDCSGPALGMNPIAATGFACALPNGRAGRADPTATPVPALYLSLEAARYDGADLVRVCVQSAGIATALPVQDLGVFATVDARVYMDAAQ